MMILSDLSKWEEEKWAYAPILTAIFDAMNKRKE